MSKDLETLEKRLSEAKEYSKDHTKYGCAYALGYLESAVENYISVTKKGGEKHGKQKSFKK